MNQFAKKVRAILEKANKVDSETGEALLGKSQEEQRPLTEIVVKEGVISEMELLCLIGKAANIPPIDLGKLKVEKEVLDAVPVDLARDYQIFPVDRIGSILTIAVANPFDVLKLDDIRIITGCQLRPVLTTQEVLERMIPVAYRGNSETVRLR